ncbi:exonuclease subunit SbcD [Myxococcota bacterium]|nr:exonuclease subunit SbcD [Myxococcota bacterium]
MRILHTSDWHLGHTLYRRDRDAEHAAFLTWLADALADEPVDALVVAGDVFDGPQPDLVSRTRYHDFLARIARERWARTVVIIGGNHDSAGLLDVSRTVLAALEVFVFGARVAPEDALVTVRGVEGQPVGVIAAVPFLRGPDLGGLAEARQGGDVDAAIRQAITAHYEAVSAAARARPDLEGLPLVATGHLYADGSLTVDESVRDIQIGRQQAVPLEAFGGTFDYVALGHLHREGCVFGRPHIRYCGAPLPMSFAEAAGPKYVLRVTARAGLPPDVDPLAVPVFRRLLRLSGPLDGVRAALQASRETAAEERLTPFAEVTLPHGVWSPAVRDELIALGRLCGVEVLIVRAEARPVGPEALADRDVALEDLRPEEVFEARLTDAGLPADAAAALRTLFAEVLQAVHDAETPA